jgi:hypothetical protein
MNNDSTEDGSLSEYFAEFKLNYANVFTEKQWEVLEEITAGIYDDIMEKLDNIDTAIMDVNGLIAELE